jgi:hypothetical protein
MEIARVLLDRVLLFDFDPIGFGIFKCQNILFH